MDLPSPRVGDTPPALSPLDAFALHSRMLAKKFDEEAEAGRRLSRLPHNTVARELANRPNYFRAQRSADNMSDILESQEDARPNTRGGLAVSRHNGPKDRPTSLHPMLGRVTRLEDENERAETPFFDAIEEQAPSESPDYFAMPRALSPDPADPRVNIEAPSPNPPSLTNSVESLASTRLPERRNHASERNLLPMRSPMMPKTSRSMQSIRPVRQDSGDDDSSSQNGGTRSVRKFSGSSGVSVPQSPFTPGFVHHAHRSPSMNSEYSVSGFAHSPRPAMNFSRPDRPMSPDPPFDARQSFDSRRSFESRPSADTLNRQSSMASSATQLSQQSPPRKQNHEPIPKPFATEGNASDSDNGQTYTYSSFTLPRGRGIERNSMGLRTSWIEKQFTWDKSDESSSPLVQPVVSHGRKSSENLKHPTIPAVQCPSSPASIHAQPAFDERRGRNHTFTSAARSHSADPRGAVRTKPSHTPSASIATDSTERTIKPSPLQQRELSSEVSPEDHLEIGIQAHSTGQTTKSTYHLRLAANAGLPTAMLLYALACRHGWGVRANQEEGVKWLRKAIDTSKLEEQDVDKTLSAASRRSGVLDSAAELAERKKRKAQFSLAIYELGMSYMKGWGCPKDKVLALRCYEIAGDWGDCDALAEAGYCYTQGLGCKKDMHKAAMLYRKAADGGMSMTGNSW